MTVTESKRKYAQSEKGKATDRKYRLSAKYRIALARYSKSGKGRTTRLAWRKSPNGLKYEARQKEMLSVKKAWFLQEPRHDRSASQ